MQLTLEGLESYTVLYDCILRTAAPGTLLAAKSRWAGGCVLYLVRCTESNAPSPTNIKFDQQHWDVATAARRTRHGATRGVGKAAPPLGKAYMCLA